MTLTDAYRILGLSNEANLAQVKAAYRRKVADAHPDRGGTAAEFIKVRAAYEILVGFVGRQVSDGAAAGAGDVRTPAEEEIPIPDDLRAVIDQIVAEFREHQRWAEEETVRQLATLQTTMLQYLKSATRAELRQFSAEFRLSWNAMISALFDRCNERSDEILQHYERWYTTSTQAVFDDLYRKDVLSFVRSRRFWEVFVFVAAVAGALTVVIGWGGGRRWVSIAVMLVALGIAFAVYWRGARKRRQVREKSEALAVVPFEIPENELFPTEHTMRRGRRTTAAFGVAGLFLGASAASGLAVPALAGVVGTALGGAFDRFVNPTGRMRERMQTDLLRFMEVARPQLVWYVLEAHQVLLSEVRTRIAESYQERVKYTVKLLTDGR
jgi:curved DNA-binding protein CbpA